MKSPGHAVIEVSLLAGLVPEARKILGTRGTTRRYAAGQVLFTAGSPALGLFIILEGRVRVTAFRWARAHAVHEEGKGGTLGEVPLFAGGGYPATAVAAEPTVCVILSREVIAAILQADPGWAWVLLERLAQRVRHLVGRLDRNTAQTVPGRIASFLLDRNAKTLAGAFDLGKSQAEVAEDLGTVREVVVRTLARLRRAGLIRNEGRGRYRVVNVEGLVRIVEGSGV